MSAVQIPINFSAPAGARRRLRKSCIAVWERLKEGPATSSELLAIGGIRYGARLGELKAAGVRWDKRALDAEHRCYRYWLVAE